MSKLGTLASSRAGSYGEAGSLAQSVLVNGSGNPLIDGVLSGVRWNSLTLTVQFPGNAADYGQNYGQGEPNSFLAITQAQASAFNWASVLVRDYTRLDLVPGNSTTANLRMANFTAPNGTSHGYYPDGFPTMGDIWMGSHNNNSAGPITNPQVGDFNFATHLHEFGHALGLKHGHQAGILGAGVAKQPNGTIIPNYGPLPSNFDNWNYSIMTYRSYSGASADPVQGFLVSDNPITFMPADILALQYMYGPEYGGISSGNTTYRWDANGFYSVNGAVQVASDSER